MQQKLDPLFHLCPLVVSDATYSATLNSEEPFNVEITQTFSVSDVPDRDGEGEEQVQRKLIFCEFRAKTDKASPDALSLAMKISAIFECNENVNIKEAIQSHGIPMFTEKMRDLVSNFTKILGCGELKI